MVLPIVRCLRCDLFWIADRVLCNLFYFSVRLIQPFHQLRSTPYVLRSDILSILPNIILKMTDRCNNGGLIATDTRQYFPTADIWHEVFYPLLPALLCFTVWVSLSIPFLFKSQKLLYFYFNVSNIFIPSVLSSLNSLQSDVWSPAGWWTGSRRDRVRETHTETCVSSFTKQNFYTKRTK